MRWERLFADLEAEAVELETRDRDAEIAERTRAELARVRWLERVRGSSGASVRVALAGGQWVDGRVGYVGPDWLLLHPSGADDVLLPAHAVVGVEGAARSVDPGEQRLPLTWSAAWRTLSRDRVVVRVTRSDGSVVGGTVGRVGADFAEVDRATDPDVGGSGAGAHRARRPSAAVLVPYAAVRSVHVPREGDPG